VSVERHEEAKGTSAGERRADVVLYNYDTNETLSAVVTLGPRQRVEELRVAPDQAPGLGVQEVEEAEQLALANPIVQAELRAAGLTGREQELHIAHIMAQAVSPDDPCSTDRCVVLFFSTPDFTLDIEPVVNLTTGQVEIP
jgi:Cu2+-containing amine oxidase